MIQDMPGTTSSMRVRTVLVINCTSRLGKKETINNRWTALSNSSLNRSVNTDPSSTLVGSGKDICGSVGRCIMVGRDTKRCDAPYEIACGRKEKRNGLNVRNGRRRKPNAIIIAGKNPASNGIAMNKPVSSEIFFVYFRFFLFLMVNLCIL